MLLCSGKVFYDLHEGGRSATPTPPSSVEQLYDAVAEVKAALGRYSAAEDFVWVQEEPANQGGGRSSR